MKFTPFYKTRRFITLLTKRHHWTRHITKHIKLLQDVFHKLSTLDDYQLTFSTQILHLVDSGGRAVRGVGL